MLEKITHDKLTEIVKYEKPYRGRKETGKDGKTIEIKEYPYWYREHGYKYFRPYTNEEGTISYKVMYYANHLVTVHPNNIVEFGNPASYYQGDTIILKSLNATYGENGQWGWTNGSKFREQKDRGGYVYIKVLDAEAKYYTVRPIRMGMKFDMISDEPIVPYDLTLKKLVRKKAQKIKSDHIHVRQLLHSWVNALDDKEISEQIKEIKEEQRGAPNEWAYLDALYESGMHINAVVVSATLGNIAHYFDSHWQINSWGKEKLVDRLMDCYYEYLYERNVGTYSKKVIPSELGYYPTSKYPIEVNMRGDNNAR